jgi:AcrR family transcriptional regulator
VIARRGLDRARYSDIAHESGVAVSTLQHAFGRLDEILNLAFEHALANEARFLDELPTAQAAGAWERMEAFIAGALASPLEPHANSQDDQDSWLIWVELWRTATRDAETSRRTTATYRRWWRAAEEIIEHGQQEGSFTRKASAHDLAVAINALIDGLAVGLLLRHDRGDLDSARRIALLAARRTLATE